MKILLDHLQSASHHSERKGGSWAQKETMLPFRGICRQQVRKVVILPEWQVYMKNKTVSNINTADPTHASYSSWTLALNLV